GTALGTRGHADPDPERARGPGPRVPRRGRVGGRRVAHVLGAPTMSMTSGARRRPGGFTLMEVMLALAIFGIVTTMLYGTFARTLRSKMLAEQRAEVTRLGRAAVGRMADE